MRFLADIPLPYTFMRGGVRAATANCDHSSSTLFRAALPSAPADSANGPALAAASAVDAARSATLRALRASPAEYVCVLTSGATAGLRLISEALPWDPSSQFWCAPGRAALSRARPEPALSESGR